MLEDNTYDFSNIKFGIVVSPELPGYSEKLANGNIEEQKEILNKLLESNETHIIDYKEFDGLDIDEILKTGSQVQAEKTIIFIAYNGFEINCNSNETKKYFGEINSFFIQYDGTPKGSSLSSILAHEFAWQFFSGGYNFSETYRKRLLCFFQRYIYGTHEEAIKGLNNSIKSFKNSAWRYRSIFQQKKHKE